MRNDDDDGCRDEIDRFSKNSKSLLVQPASRFCAYIPTNKGLVKEEIGDVRRGDGEEIGDVLEEIGDVLNI